MVTIPNGRKYRIGIDVGGTNTDGVLLDCTLTHNPLESIVAFYKTPTTPNVTEGIKTAIEEVLKQSNINSNKVLSVTIGTTQFVNAVVEADARRLSKVAVLRLCGPYTRILPPFCDILEPLKNVIYGYHAFLSGGFEVDGREITKIDEEEVTRHCEHITSLKDVFNIVVCGVFSPLDANGTQEKRVASIIGDFFKKSSKKVNVVCSSDVGQIGLLERENASILNAAILPFARKAIRGFDRAIKSLNLNCPLYLTQNDGSLTDACNGARLPIRTFSSGATNSMRGATYLTGAHLRKAGDATETMLVIDIGGTTTDVGALLPSGFPRQAASFVNIGGIRTNFSMPDIISIGLGGGSRIRKLEDGHVTVGPDSVGNALLQDALAFGGNVLTTTDVAVRQGIMEVGDPAKVDHLNADLCCKANAQISRLLEKVIDKMKTSKEDIQVVFVGGGTIIAPHHLAGVSKVIVPKFATVANAIGAAISKVSGDVDTIKILTEVPLKQALDEAKEIATRNAVQNGANSETVSIVEVDYIPLAYVTNKATRIVVKAAGELDLLGVPATSSFTNEGSETDDEDLVVDIMTQRKEQAPFDPVTYRPTVDPKSQVWILSEVDIEWIAEGCGILGTGGGGSTYAAFLACRNAIREGRILKIKDVADIKDDQWVPNTGYMGSPSVGIEKLPAGTEAAAALECIWQYTGSRGGTVGLMSAEIGGGNGVWPILVASLYDLPAIDADWMGRAYPNLWMMTPVLYGHSIHPCAQSDAKGNTLLMTSATSPYMVEDVHRAICTEFGAEGCITSKPFSGRVVKDLSIWRTLSQAWFFGRAVNIARHQNTSIVASILSQTTGKVLFVGKIIDIQREVIAGFTRGRIIMSRLDWDEMVSLGDIQMVSRDYNENDTVVIPFQNENIYAELVHSNGESSILASSPDLITVLDAQNGIALGTPDYRYGLRVIVLGMACSPHWRTEMGLRYGGVVAFGYKDINYTPLGDYQAPKSVIETYAKL